MEQRITREELILNESLNCAQKVVGTFCGAYGIPACEGIRMARALGGGLRAGEACGAMVGALLVVGLKYGPGEDQTVEARMLCDQKAAELSRRFREMQGQITCRELLGIDTSIGENRKIAAEMGLFREICPNIVAQTIELLEELGYGDGR